MSHISFQQMDFFFFDIPVSASSPPPLPLIQGGKKKKTRPPLRDDPYPFGAGPGREKPKNKPPYLPLLATDNISYLARFHLTGIISAQNRKAKNTYVQDANVQDVSQAHCTWFNPELILLKLVLHLPRISPTSFHFPKTCW